MRVRAAESETLYSVNRLSYQHFSLRRGGVGKRPASDIASSDDYRLGYINNGSFKVLNCNADVGFVPGPIAFDGCLQRVSGGLSCGGDGWCVA